MITRIVKAKLKPEHLEAFKNYIPEFLKEARCFKNNHHADCFADEGCETPQVIGGNQHLKRKSDSLAFL